MARYQKMISLNRVEGDLEIHIELDRDNVVTMARSVGTMYRGIENLMSGREPLDSLVITPRICGICTTAHLNAAARALDMACEVTIPPDAQRLRNATLMVEQLQNDMRHLCLLFMPDFTRPFFADQPLFGEAVARYRPLNGESTVQTILETRKLIEIIAILGGQWPHSSFMVPGGVVTVPNASDLAQCRHILNRFRRWYEKRVLGCSIDRWQAVSSREALMAWLDADAAHAESEMGFFVRMGLAAGLDRIGRAHDRFISGGGPEIPQPDGETAPLFPAGVFTSAGTADLDVQKITEDVSCSFFEPSPGHPFESVTRPDADPSDDRKYSWAKAPRYDGQPAETGPLADLLMARTPLFDAWIRQDGASIFIRELARMARPALILPVVEQCLAGMSHSGRQYYTDTLNPLSATSVGIVSAPRGMLSHWIVIRDGRFQNYQVITPTAWNGSPRDADGTPGPWEQAMIGTVVRDPEDPVEVEQIVRSFDPCLVCTVHAIRIRR
jgi:uptake hydrogenase large subunit